MKHSYLINERIYLRAVEPEDIELMYEMENDWEMWDISSFTVPYSRYVFHQYIQNSQCDMFADKQLRLIIVRKSDNRSIGTIDITDFVPLHSRGGVGIALHRDCRGAGFASDALNLLCDYAFNFLSIKQLYAYVALDNEASMKLFVSSGFVKAGILKDWLLVESVYKDAALLQCLNPNKK